jgi:hypothetical protein
MRCHALAICGEREGAQAQPQRRRVAGERQFDGFAGQPSPSPVSSNRAARLTRQPRGWNGGIARPAPGEPHAPVPHLLFPLFYQVEIRRCQLLQ